VQNVMHLYKRFLIACLVVICCVVFNSDGVFAYDKDSALQEVIQMSISVGLDNCMKYDRLSTVTAEIFNMADTRDAFFQVYRDDEKLEGGTYIYQKKVHLESKVTTTVSIVIPVNSLDNRVNVRLIDEEGKILAQRTQNVNIDTNMRCYNIGIIGNSIDYLKLISDIYCDFFTLDLNELPKQVETLDMLDLIFVQEGYIDDFYRIADPCIEQWVHNGGAIVIARNMHGKGYLDHSHEGIGIKNTEGESVFQKYTCGKGVVIEWTKKENILAAFRDTSIDNDYWDSIGSQLSYLKGREKYWEKFADFNFVKNMPSGLSQQSPKTMPKLLITALVLFLYACIIGPNMYIVLKKLKKGICCFLFIPITMFLFCGIIYFVNVGNKMDSPLYTYSDIEIYDETTNECENEMFFSVMQGQDKKILGSIPAGSLLEYNIEKQEEMNNKDRESDNNLVITQGKDKTSFLINNTKFLKSYRFRSVNKGVMNGKIKYDLNCEGEEIKGNVKNNLGYDLHNAVLVSNCKMIFMGELKAGEIFHITDKVKQTLITSFFTPEGTLSNTNLVNKMIGKTIWLESSKENLYLRYNTMLYCMRSKLLQYTSDSYIFAFTDKKCRLDTDNEASTGVSSLVYHLANVKNESEDKLKICDLSKYFYHVVGNGDPVSRIIESNTLSVTYLLPPEVKLKGLVYSKNLNNEFLLDAQEGFYGTISLFNFKTSTYDEVFKYGEENRIYNMSDYVTELNKVIVKYNVDEVQRTTHDIILPVLSAVTEVE